MPVSTVSIECTVDQLPDLAFDLKVYIKSYCKLLPQVARISYLIVGLNIIMFGKQNKKTYIVKATKNFSNRLNAERRLSPPNLMVEFETVEMNSHSGLRWRAAE